MFLKANEISFYKPLTNTHEAISRHPRGFPCLTFYSKGRDLVLFLSKMKRYEGFHSLQLELAASNEKAYRVNVKIKLDPPRVE